MKLLPYGFILIGLASLIILVLGIFNTKHNVAILDSTISLVCMNSNKEAMPCEAELVNNKLVLRRLK